MDSKARRSGQALGTYNQTLSPKRGDPIYSVGRFGEFFWKMTPCFTMSVGYGMDDSRGRNLVVLGGAVGKRTRNEADWGNAIWKLSEAWETRFDVSHLGTTYIAPSNASASVLYHGSVRYRF